MAKKMLIPIPTEDIQGSSTGKFLVTREMLNNIPDAKAVTQALHELSLANPDYIFHWNESHMDGGYYIKWRKKRSHEPRPDDSEDLRDLPGHV